jgi:hypothetical protein
MKTRGIGGDESYLQNLDSIESPCRKPCAFSASNVITQRDENRRNLLIHCVVFLDHHKHQA